MPAHRTGEALSLPGTAGEGVLREQAMIHATPQRVPSHTSDDVNAAIRERTLENIAHFRSGDPVAINHRLEELDHEWDIERALEANAASVVLLGVCLGACVDRRFFAIPAIVGGFLLQHAVQGWCPPVPILRRLGFRTEREINNERTALKLQRGDFQHIADGAYPAERLLHTVEA